MADQSDTATVTHARATVRPDKAATVAELAEAFRGSSAAVLTEYRGLTVKQISELRRVLGADTTYAVVKNSLTKIAATDAGLDGMDALLTGPTAVAFVKGDPVEAAKGLRDFAKTAPSLVVKGGVMDGKALTADEVRKLADLESREVLLGKLAGAMLASLSRPSTCSTRRSPRPPAWPARCRPRPEDPSVLRGRCRHAGPAARPARGPPRARAAEGGRRRRREARCRRGAAADGRLPTRRRGAPSPRPSPSGHHARRDRRTATPTA
jgi:large subunit ribosomal protein L10